MSNKTIPWRSLTLVLLVSCFMGMTSVYRLNLSVHLIFKVVSALLYGVAFYVGFQASRTAIPALEQRFGKVFAFLMFAGVIGAGYMVGFAVAMLLS